MKGNNIMTNNVSAYIRNLYAPEFSSIMLSFFKTNLSISFMPWLGRNDMGRSQYDTKNSQRTTISDENAAALYSLARAIIDGKQTNPVQYVVERNKDTRLIFEYRQNQNNQMRAYLSLEKNGQTILFEFAVHLFKEKENGRVVVKEIQAGLEAFSQVMIAYLTAIGADRQLYAQQADTSQNGSSMWN